MVVVNLWSGGGWVKLLLILMFAVMWWFGGVGGGVGGSNLWCFGCVIFWAVGCCRWSDARVVQLGPAHLSPSVLNFFVRLACGGVLAEHLNSMVVCCQTRT